MKSFAILLPQLSAFSIVACGLFYCIYTGIHGTGRIDVGISLVLTGATLHVALPLGTSAMKALYDTLTY